MSSELPAGESSEHGPKVIAALEKIDEMANRAISLSIPPAELQEATSSAAMMKALKKIHEKGGDKALRDFSSKFAEAMKNRIMQSTNSGDIINTGERPYLEVISGLAKDPRFGEPLRAAFDDVFNRLNINGNAKAKLRAALGDILSPKRPGHTDFARQHLSRRGFLGTIGTAIIGASAKGTLDIVNSFPDPPEVVDARNREKEGRFERERHKKILQEWGVSPSAPDRRKELEAILSQMTSTGKAKHTEDAKEEARAAVKFLDESDLNIRPAKAVDSQKMWASVGIFVMASVGALASLTPLAIGVNDYSKEYEKFTALNKYRETISKYMMQSTAHALQSLNPSAGIERG